MRPWLGKAIGVLDACYADLRASEPAAEGTISFSVAMHANARPSGRLGSVAPGLRGLVVCATQRLMGVKMPLFTGTEGASYTVSVLFSP